MTKEKTLIWISSAVTVVAVAALLVAAKVGRPIPQSVLPQTVPVTIEVEETLAKSNQPATLRMTTSQNSQIVAGAASGTITKSNLQVGDTITSGTVLMWVNSQPVWAIEGAPLYRSLIAGDQGEDVKTVQEFLQKFFDSKQAISGKMDQATVRTIKSWQKKNSLPVTGDISLENFVWIERPVTINEIKFSLGAAVPAPGEPLFKAKSHFVAAEITPQKPVTAGSYVFLTDGIRAEVSLDEEGNWTFLDDEQRNALLAIYTQDLVKAEESLFASQSNVVDIAGRIEVQHPVPAFMVPAAALFQDSDNGNLCVWVQEGDDFQAFKVDEILETRASGTVAISAPELSKKFVLLDPVAKGQELKCP